MLRFIASVGLATLFVLGPSLTYAQSAEEILAQFDAEPTVEETQQAALEFSGLTGERLDSMYGRAAGAKALPKSVHYKFVYRDQDKKRPQSVSTFDGKGDLTNKRDTVYSESTDYLQHEVRAQWDLSGLVYNPDQLRVYAQMNSSSKSRDQLLARVTKSYFARRKLQADIATKPASDVTARLKQELALQELTAQLDASTGGWFSEQLRTKGARK